MKKWIAYLTGTAAGILVLAGILFKVKKPAASSIAIIGGADGPTSVFIAGKVGDEFPVALIAAGMVLALAAIWLFRKK